MKMKNMILVIVALVATVAQATPVVSLETESSFAAINSADFAWNVQFFQNDGNGNQYSIGPGFSGFDIPNGTTSWSASNPISVLLVGNINAQANTGPVVQHGSSIPYHELWVVVQDNTPVGSFLPGDFLGLENISVNINGDTVNPGNIQVFPDDGFAAFKVSTSASNPALISNFSISADLTQQHTGAVGKDWIVSAYGVVIPEPNTFVLMTISLTALCVFKKFRL
jgi:hypothetical protein